MPDVVILGVGAAGEVTARLLGSVPQVDNLRIVDARPERLREVSGRIRRDVEAMCANLARAADVRRACEGATVIVNASSPETNLRVMRQSVRLRAHYVDLGSEGSPSSDGPSNMHDQLAFDAEFRRIHRTAILGMGLAPGITNLLARHGSAAMRRIDAVRIRVYGSGYAEIEDHPLAPLFAPRIFLEEVLWPACVWKGDRVQKLPPFSGEEEFRFPDPLGTASCYNVNNEECETMPTFIGGGIQYIDFKYAIAPRRRVLLENLHKLGLTKTDLVRVKGVNVAPLDLLLALLPDPSSLAGRAVGHTSVVVEVEGRNGERRIRRRLWTILDHEDAYRKMRVHATAFLTGAPPAAAVVALLDDEIRRRGVTTGGGIDAGPLLRRLMKLGVPLFEGEIGCGRGRPLAV